MFITAVCVLFLIKLRWPKTKSLFEYGLVVPVSRQFTNEQFQPFLKVKNDSTKKKKKKKLANYETDVNHGIFVCEHHKIAHL